MKARVWYLILKASAENFMTTKTLHFMGQQNWKSPRNPQENYTTAQTLVWAPQGDWNL